MSRFAAVTATFAMDDESSVPGLAEALAAEESLRIRNRIAQGLMDRGWIIPEDLRETFRAELPPEFVLQGDKVGRA